MESEKSPGFPEDDDHHHRNRPEKMEEASSKRSYECVFCKRGFTNAQALGGHMNIHRKHRSSTKSSSSSSSKQLLNPNSNRTVTHVITGPFPFEKSSHSWEALRSKLSTNLDPTKYLHNTYNPIMVSCNSNFGEKLGSNLTLQIGPSCPNNNEEDIAPNSDDGEERDQDIDLELRLGRAHHP